MTEQEKRYMDIAMNASEISIAAQYKKKTEEEK